MIREGTKVKWKWGEGYATGKVIETSDDTMEKTFDGSKIKRKGSKDNLALLIEQESGEKVLKLQSEVERADE